MRPFGERAIIFLGVTPGRWRSASFAERRRAAGGICDGVAVVAVEVDGNPSRATKGRGPRGAYVRGWVYPERQISRLERHARARVGCPTAPPNGSTRRSQSRSGRQERAVQDGKGAHDPPRLAFAPGGVADGAGRGRAGGLRCGRACYRSGGGTLALVSSSPPMRQRARSTPSS